MDSIKVVDRSTGTDFRGQTGINPFSGTQSRCGFCKDCNKGYACWYCGGKSVGIYCRSFGK
eukprot:2138016-Amphidinium_carterae.1